MTIARGNAGMIPALHFRFNNTKGSSARDAPVNRINVNDIGLIIPASFSDARKEPATRRGQKYEQVILQFHGLLLMGTA